MKVLKPTRGMSAILAGTVCLGLISACSDADAESRAETQETLLAASAEFRNVTLSSASVGDDDFASRQQELNSLIGRVSNLQNAQPGQQAAGSMLAAEALSELATMHLTHAQKLHRKHRFDRLKIQSMLGAMDRLNARVESLAQITLSAERSALQAQREQAEGSLNELSRRLQALDGPIADRTQRNEQDIAEADRLRAEANDLIRQAIELGHANGFPSFEQAMGIRRDADGIDFDVALRELELEYELHPEHRLSELQIEHLRSSIESVRATLEEFDRLGELFASDLATTRDRVSDLAGQASDAIAQLRQDVTGELTEQYETAIEYLERAASQAGQAAGRLRGDQGSSARMTQAKVNESLGIALRSKANALDDLSRLLSSVNETGRDVMDVSNYDTLRGTLDERQQDLRQRAQEALTQAEQALSGVSGSGVDAFRRYLQELTGSAAGDGGMNEDF